MKKNLHYFILLLTAVCFGQAPIYHFPFNGNMNSSDNSVSLTSTQTQTYVSNGSADNSALFVNVPNSDAGRAGAPTALLNLLPTGNAARTVVLRVNLIATSSPDYIFGWGTPSNGQSFALEHGASTTTVSGWGQQSQGFSANFTTSPAENTWVDYIIVFGGSQAKIYFNGQEFPAVAISNNVVGQQFVLGRSVIATFGQASFYLDDLKIYNYAFTDQQALNYSTNNNLPYIQNNATITNITSSVPNNSTANVNCTINGYGTSTSTVVKYGLSSTTMTQTSAPVITTGSSNSSVVIPLSGLAANTIYYCAIESTNANGTHRLGSNYTFTTPPFVDPLAPIYHFPFNGNLNSAVGTASLNYVQGGFSWVSNGQTAGNAIQINNEQTILQANLPNLPVGNAPRTVAVRINFNTSDASLHTIFGWGTGASNQAYGFQQSNTITKNYYWGTGDYNVNNTMNSNTWYNMTLVYDGSNVKIYKDGVEIGTTTRTLATLGTIFKMGSLPSNPSASFLHAVIDDLRIYNYALTQSQIQALNTSLNPAVTLPVISNVSVGNLIHEGANISYTVNANGATTDTFVLYGKLPAANEVVAVGTVATGTNNTACSAITQYNSTPGAAPAGTTMYYKVQATNASGTVFSPVFQYTQVTKPTYELSSATSITTNSATLNYTLNPCGANATSIVRYGTSAGNYTNTTTGFSALGFTPNTSTVVLSALSPNTTYFYIVEGTNVYGVSQSIVGNFTTQGTAPTLTNINVSAITNNSASVNFDLNTGGTSTTTTVFYGTSSSNLNLSAVGPTVTNNVATTYTVNLSVLLPNTTYYYNVVANGNGQTTSATNSFTTAANPTVPTPIYNFEFNNNLQSQDGSVTLNPPIAGSYGFVSNGTIADGALQINDARSQTSLPNIPLGTSSRSVHLKLRFASGALATENFVFNWGTGVTGQAFAYHQTATTAKLLGWGGAGYDYASIPSSGANFGQWYEYVFTYNGTAMSVYRDGVLLGSTNVTLNTTGDVFRLGVSNSGIQKLQADIDYVRIYNQALNSAQVSLLYANPNLSNPDVASNAVSFVMYPNPAFDSVSIAIETPVKSVEIYTLQGQKVVSTSLSEIVISDLSSGIYLVKVEDVHGNVATQKLVKK